MKIEEEKMDQPMNEKPSLGQNNNSFNLGYQGLNIGQNI
jgi:hypothetical protein